MNNQGVKVPRVLAEAGMSQEQFDGTFNLTREIAMDSADHIQNIMRTLEKVHPLLRRLAGDFSDCEAHAELSKITRDLSEGMQMVDVAVELSIHSHILFKHADSNPIAALVAVDGLKSAQQKIDRMAEDKVDPTAAILAALFGALGKR